MVKTGFKNPIADKPAKSLKSPWNFDCPPYDERTSCFLNAGAHHGVGHRQPVGHKGDPKQRVDCMPFGRVQTMETDSKSKHNERIEIDE